MNQQSTFSLDGLSRQIPSAFTCYEPHPPVILEWEPSVIARYLEGRCYYLAARLHERFGLHVAHLETVDEFVKEKLPEHALVYCPQNPELFLDISGWRTQPDLIQAAAKDHYAPELLKVILDPTGERLRFYMNTPGYYRPFSDYEKALADLVIDRYMMRYINQDQYSLKLAV